MFGPNDVKASNKGALITPLKINFSYFLILSSKRDSNNYL